MEWIQPTPTPFALADLVLMVEVSSSEEEPEEDHEDGADGQQLAPDAEMLSDPEEDDEPMIDLDPEQEATPEPTAESVDESGPGWLVESEESESQDYRLEWMAPAHSSRYPRSPTVPAPPPEVEVVPSRSSLEFTVVPDIDQSGSSETSMIVISSDSSSIGDTDSSSSSYTPLS